MPASGGEAYFALAMEMTAMARTAVVPEAAPVGALSAQLRRPLSRPATAALRRSAPFDRTRPTSAQGQSEKRGII